MSDQDAATIRRLYEGLDQHDGEAMAACYHPDATFEDPAFGKLTGVEAGDMWRMLTRPPSDVRVELRAHDAAGGTGSANWIATYTFSRTGRPVVNDVHATFVFRDGLIADHVDSFSFATWSRQALGLPGTLLGWTPILPALFQKKARGLLDEFRAERASAAAPAA